MDSKELAIDIQQLSKVYHIYNNPRDRLKQSLSLNRKKYYHEFWALKNVSFSVQKGETIGIIGRNGSGKSTLLQVIAGILTPSAGSAAVHGRMAALLELGAGFNPEMTGRENAYLNATLLGVPQNQIEEQMPRIEKFAEIGDFIDQPVKLYSSGMFVRLAFACAVNVNPDILIVDEALAVGDLQFQLKCIEKMKSFKRQGKTILFVSHDTYSVKNFCDSAVWMRDGQVYLRGDVNTVTHEYEEFMKLGAAAYEEDTPVPATVASETEPKKHVVTIEKIHFWDANHHEKKDFCFGESLTVEIEYVLHTPLDGIVGGIALYDKNNTYICGLNTKLDQCRLPSRPGRHRLAVRYQDMKLLPGTYFIDIGFFDSSAVVNLDYKSRFDYFRIVNNGEYFAEGVTFIPHRWECGEES